MTEADEFEEEDEDPAIVLRELLEELVDSMRPRRGCSGRALGRSFDGLASRARMLACSSVGGAKQSTRSNTLPSASSFVEGARRRA